jgi:hypothetical protein
VHGILSKGYDEFNKRQIFLKQSLHTLPGNKYASQVLEKDRIQPLIGYRVATKGDQRNRLKREY